MTTTARLIGALTIAVTLPCTVLLIVFAASPTLQEHASIALLVIAVVLQILCMLLWSVWMSAPSRWITPSTFASTDEKRVTTLRSRRSEIALAAMFIVTLATAAVTGFALGQIHQYANVATFAGHSFGPAWLATVLLWLASFLTQAACVLCIFRSAVLPQLATTSPRIERADIDPTPPPPPPMMQRSRSTTVTTGESNPFAGSASGGETAPASPPSAFFASAAPSEAERSVRSSVSTLHRHGSLRKPALSRQPSQVRSTTTATSSPAMGLSHQPSQDEGFDSWDTSGVSSQIRETVLQSRPLGVNTVGLPTIPGSRSPSPAKALEGPFFTPSPDDSPPVSPLPQPSVSRPHSPADSPAADIPNFTSVFPPAHGLSRTLTSRPPDLHIPPPNQAFSRPPSSARSVASEEHIHPLFRTTSPAPPPSASSNTTVTAAPEGGQLVSSRAFRRIKSGSLPPMPSPLVRSESVPDFHAATRVALGTISGNIPKMPALSSSAGSAEIKSTAHRRKRSLSLESAIIHD